MARKEPDPFELNEDQIRELIRLAEFREKDVFYDLGSCTGKVVIRVVQQTKVKKAIGIESKKKYYSKARANALHDLTEDQLARIDFWYGYFDDEADDDPEFYDIKDATVVFNSLHEEPNERDDYRTQFRKKRIRVIKKDLPLVGYESTANRSNADCWLFLMQYPLAKVTSKKEWVTQVMGKNDATIDDLYKYYQNQLKKRPQYDRKGIIDTILDLKKLVNARF